MCCRTLVFALFLSSTPVFSATLFEVAASQETPADRLVVDAVCFLKKASTEKEDKEWEKKKDALAAQAEKENDALSKESYTQSWILAWGASKLSEIKSSEDLDTKTLIAACRILKYCAQRRITLPAQILSEMTPQRIEQARTLLQERCAAIK